MDLVILIIGAAVAFVLYMSFWKIGPTEIGLVRKRFGLKKLDGGNIIGFRGEAGYQAELLRTGIRFKLWLIYAVQRRPIPQIPAGEIAVVIAQVGAQLPVGAKSAVYKPEFGNFTDLKAFVDGGGQKGLQRLVLSPGTVAAIHPVGFLVISKHHVYGIPVSEELVKLAHDGKLTYQSFGLTEKQLEVARIEPKAERDGKIIDMIGIVTTLEGAPLPKGAIANRLDGFDDIVELERAADTKDSALVEAILSVKNEVHNNYQDFQRFLDNGGRACASFGSSVTALRRKSTPASRSPRAWRTRPSRNQAGARSGARSRSWRSLSSASGKSPASKRRLATASVASTAVRPSVISGAPERELASARPPAHQSRHIARYAASTRRAKPAPSHSGDARMRSRKSARSRARPSRSCASPAAVATYASGVVATRRSSPIAVSMLAPTREAWRSPRSVTTGTPIHSASAVVAVPL
jgi:hypothetical protein